MNNQQLHKHLGGMLGQLQQQIDQDMSDGTTIPGRYQDVQILLDQAKLSLSIGNTEKTLELIGEINLDALQEIDDIDDTLGDVLQKLKSLQDRSNSHENILPQEILEELQVLRKILGKYDIVSGGEV